VPVCDLEEPQHTTHAQAREAATDRFDPGRHRFTAFTGRLLLSSLRLAIPS